MPGKEILIAISAAALVFAPLAPARADGRLVVRLCSGGELINMTIENGKKPSGDHQRPCHAVCASERTKQVKDKRLSGRS